MKASNRDPLIDRNRTAEVLPLFDVEINLLTELAAKIDGQTRERSLSQSCLFDDDELIEELVALGFRPENFPAIYLIPLVLIAWSNHKVPEIERLAVLKFANEKKIVEGSEAFKFLEQWMTTEPEPELGLLWEHYTRALVRTLSPATRARLSGEVMQRARAVATSGHRLLSFGRLAEEERLVMERLENAFRVA